MTQEQRIEQARQKARRVIELAEKLYISQEVTAENSLVAAAYFIDIANEYEQHKVSKAAK